MSSMYVVIMKSESGDNYNFKTDHILTDDEINNFIKTHLPYEYDEESDEYYIYEFEYINIDKLTHINDYEK